METSVSRRGLLGVVGGAAVTGAGVVAAPAAALPSQQQQQLTPVDWVDVTDHGMVGDGSTDDQPALAAILNGVGAGGTLYFPKGSYRLGSDVEIPLSVTVKPDRGAILAPDSGTQLTVHAVVDAGLYQIFGNARVVGSFGGSSVVPQWFGAVADGVTDDAPTIRMTVNVLSNSGGGTMYLPPGTYLLQDTVGHPADSGSHPFIVPRSGVHIVGAGDSSVLKAADGLNSTHVGGFNVIYPLNSSEQFRVDDASFRNFKVDCNGANNLQPDVEGRKAKNCAVGVRRGSDIIVDSVTVVNNAGRQCFQFGDNVKPQTVTNLRITNCYVDTFAQGVEGNIHQNDHSVIYAQADGCVVSNNVLVQPSTGANNEPVNNGTGIELHAKNAVVSGNVMRNIDKAMNLVASVTDLSGVVVSNNVCRHSSRSVDIWCYPGQAVNELLISDNVFEQSGLGDYDDYPFDFGFLDASVHVQSQVTDVAVLNNVFTYSVVAEPQRGTACMVFGAVRDLVVRGNRISGFTGAGIQIQESWISEPTDPEDSSIVIDDNEIVDCGRSPDPTKRRGVNLITRQNLALLSIRNNVFRRTMSDAMEIGIRASLVIGTTRVSGNTWMGVPTPCKWPVGAVGDSLTVEHIGPGNPIVDTIPASVGSTWANPVQEKYWFKATGKAVDGWQERTPASES